MTKKSSIVTLLESQNTKRRRDPSCVLNRRRRKPFIEALEDRRLLAFSVVGSDVYLTGSLRLRVDFSQAVNISSVQAADLVVNGSQVATSANVLDADTVEFVLPNLASGTHSLNIATGAIQDTLGTGLDPFSKTFVSTGAAQFTMKHNPRLQPGNAPLVGFPGSELDRVDILWQTIPGGSGTQDSFTVQYRPVGAPAWQSASLNTAINTGVENRVVRSASVTGLNWNSDYEYRVNHRRADVIVGEYQHTFRTRLAAGDQTPFTFAAYGDSAAGSATGFRQVQSRINQVNPSFSVLLGDNVYDVGSHQESDSRFSPTVNPEAAAWMAGHIDYLGLGNHDTYTGAGLPAEQNFSVPIPVAGVNAPAAPPASERPEHSFSWDYGDVHFVTFDTNSLDDASRLDGLLKWVVTDLNASSARWKIVYGHHPLAGVPDKPESPSGNYYQQVVNRLKAAGVDLFMTGHSHTYAWTFPLTGQINGVATYADHGSDDHFHAGEGLPQLVSGVGGVGLRTGTFTQFPFVAEGFSTSTPVQARFGFSKIDVTPGGLTVSYVAADNGQVIDSFQITKETVATATFQQGVAGYSGTVDTMLHQNTPSSNFASAASLKVDGDDPSGGLDAQALLQFNDLFGSGPGQIPLDATLRSATLQLEVTNGSINNMNVHRMIAPWAATDTWNSLVGGLQANGVEAVAAPDISSGQSQIGQLSFNVLTSLQAWKANPATNRGWAILPTGVDGVDFQASEGSIKPKLIVTYIPNNNTPPTISDMVDLWIDEDQPTGSLAFTVDDAETAASSLAVSATSSNTSLVPNGNLALGGSGANRNLMVTPALNQFGSATITVTVTDGNGGLASDTFVLSVNPVNDAPVAAGDNASTVTTTQINISVLANDSDPENNPLSVAIVTSPVNGSAVVNGNGTVTYTANVGFTGTDTFTYIANDGSVDSNVATVSVTVAGSTKFIVVDSTADRTFRYDANGSYLAQTNLASGNTSSRGVASNLDGSRLWVLDSNKTVYVYDGSMALLGSWTAGGLKTPTGISVAGNDVWIVDSGNDRVRLYAGAATRLSGSTNATSSFPVASTNKEPQDIATDGTTVWVTQSASPDRVFVYQASNGLNLGSWTIDAANTSPVGIAIDPTGASQSLWIVDNATDRVYEYANARSRTSGSQSASVSFALNSGNGDAQGIADPQTLQQLAARDRLLAAVDWSAIATGNLIPPPTRPSDIGSLRKNAQAQLRTQVPATVPTTDVQPASTQAITRSAKKLTPAIGTIKKGLESLLASMRVKPNSQES